MTHLVVQKSRQVDEEERVIELHGDQYPSSLQVYRGQSSLLTTGTPDNQIVIKVVKVRKVFTGNRCPDSLQTYLVLRKFVSQKVRVRPDYTR
jgi:hypothetical protein